MAYLFHVEGRAVSPNPETLMISPFREIWERDKSTGKKKALSEFAYVEFMSSMLRTNPYRQYPEEKKHSVVANDLMGDPKWKPDAKIQKAMEKMKLFQTEASLSYRYYMSSKQASEKMISFFNNFDMSERNDRTNLPIYKPKEITTALTDTEKVITSLDALGKKVEEELMENQKVKGQKEISPFAKRQSL